MGEYVVNRPDEGAMEAALRENFNNAAGVILLSAPSSSSRSLRTPT